MEKVLISVQLPFVQNWHVEHKNVEKFVILCFSVTVRLCQGGLQIEIFIVIESQIEDLQDSLGLLIDLWKEIESLTIPL